MVSFEQIEEYAEGHTRALFDLHARLWRETHQKTDFPGMMVGPLEGALLRFVVRLTAAKRVLEIGTFTGYSALGYNKFLRCSYRSPDFPASTPWLHRSKR